MEHEKAAQLATIAQKHFGKEEQVDNIIESITQLGFHWASSAIQAPNIDVKEELQAGMVNIGKLRMFLIDYKEIAFID
jgi:hypothetical protein